MRLATSLFLPSHCLLCETPCPPPRRWLCLACQNDLPWIRSACRGCGLPLPAGADTLHCGECLRQGSPFHDVLIPFCYDTPLRSLITGFKHRRQLLAGRLLSRLLAEAILDHYLPDTLPDLILPVPLHWRRWLWRGYNQSQELGEQLSQTLDIACRSNLLTRRHATPSQQGLNRRQRQLNLQKAFRLRGRLPAQRVALLDDVVTTGATARTLARLLQEQGAEEIHLWAIARTPVDKSST